MRNLSDTYTLTLLFLFLFSLSPCDAAAALIGHSLIVTVRKSRKKNVGRDKLLWTAA
jgi:hypothetical protein